MFYPLYFDRFEDILNIRKMSFTVIRWHLIETEKIVNHGLHYHGSDYEN